MLYIQAGAVPKMTNREELFDAIQDHPEGLDDDDLSRLTGIRPRQQVQQLCNQLAATKRIRRESVDKEGKRRKIHNFPMDAASARAGGGSENGSWERRLAALVAATGRPEAKLLDEALQLLAMKVLKSSSEDDPPLAAPQ